jgi:hypothetical protein
MIKLTTNLEPAHLEDLLSREGMEPFARAMSTKHIHEIARTPMAYSIQVDGRVIACAGVVEYWKNRGEAWAFVDRKCKREFLALHHIVRDFLDHCPVRRIEAAVSTTFSAGHRWVRALGFELEAPILRAYGPDGGDCSLYARVRDHD